METMKELYEKVAGDSALQAKFTALMKDAEKVGEEATKEKLVAFAKEAGFDVSYEEVYEYFKTLSEKEEGELSDAELDSVAGGKSDGGTVNIVVSVVTLGIGCFALSVAMGSECGESFE
jgi:predicted ribosomally synthesized peptide with nif11-like leader